MNISAKFQIHPHGRCGNDFFHIFFTNLVFRLPWQTFKFSGFDEILIFGKGLVKEYFCKTFVKTFAVR